jgi:nucleoside-diphosphate-sugar epimerase
MKLAILGGTGPLGQVLIAQALAAGHEVRALARDPGKLAPRPGLLVVPGSMTDVGSLEALLDGTDALLSCLGVTNRKRNTELSDATKIILGVAARLGVTRSVWVTSIGCGDSLPKLRRWVFRELIVKRLAKNIWDDKNRQEDVIRASAGDCAPAACATSRRTSCPIRSSKAGLTSPRPSRARGLASPTTC